MRILFVSAECTPVVKVGGLADVVGALPKALRAAGHDVRVIIPKYDMIDPVRYPSTPRWSNLQVDWNAASLLVHIDESRLPGGVPLYFMDCPEMFQPGQTLHRLTTVYANSGDPEILEQELQRFAFFSMAVASTLKDWDWQPEVVHVHDWHTALVPLMARLIRQQGGVFPPTVLTIHNLQNQGRWSATNVLKWLGWSGQEDPMLQKRDKLKNLNLLQLGIHSADAVNTVSPSYAKEILTPEYGDGLEDDLRKVSDGVHGILNGIDMQVFNPSNDPALATQYSSDTVAVGKRDNRAVLSDHLNWPIEADRPLVVSVGRLTAQKGYQLLAPIAREIFSQPLQMIILGSGSPETEKSLSDLAADHSALKLVLGFDAKLAQLLYGAGDLFLMPSQFEPCGLGQMIAMRYGTLPVVRATGGLRDTVADLSRDRQHGSGFVFEAFTPSALLEALTRALLFVRQPAELQAARQRVMQIDLSWDRSSRDYLRLYEKILK